MFQAISMGMLFAPAVIVVCLQTQCLTPFFCLWTVLMKACFFFQASNMGLVRQIGQSMSAASPPLGEGLIGPQWDNVGAAVFALQERGVENMGPPQQMILGATARTLGKCDLNYLTKQLGETDKILWLCNSKKKKVKLSP
jgi:hypothetical protein